MQHTAHVSPSAARIPRRQSLAPSQERKSLLVARSSMDELLLFAPQRAAPSQALMFPVQYHAVGECLAHPHRPCKCVKTRRMAQSQADAWLELGRRFKGNCPLAPDTPTGLARLARRSSCFEVHDRTEVADLPALTKLSFTPQKSCPVGSPAAAGCGSVRRTVSTGPASSRRKSVTTELRACSNPGQAITGPSAPQRVSGMSTPTAAGLSTPKTLSSPSTALSRSSTPKAAEQSARRKIEVLQLRLKSLVHARPASRLLGSGASGSPGHLPPVKNGASPLLPICRRHSVE
ncbi:hypothetical protein T484DRAFT_1861063 [Baffinella frigidus]|nr:hypothetical protein T484DRAFT_1861063 [Cryptophyta sp. CCMP2293]